MTNPDSLPMVTGAKYTSIISSEHLYGCFFVASMMMLIENRGDRQSGNCRAWHRGFSLEFDIESLTRSSYDLRRSLP